MRVFDKLGLRLRTLLRRNQVEAELNAELRFHFDQLVEENIAKGMPRQEARRAALRDMGSMVRFEEECRDARRTDFLEDLWRDIRIALRSFKHNRSFTAVAVLTLALGIGANTAIFSAVKAVLLQPLDYREPDRIVALQTLWTKTNRAVGVSGGDYPDVVSDPSPFSAAARYTGGELAVSLQGHSEFVPAYATDPGFTDVFQVQPVAGRLIDAAEFQSQALVAVVSEGLAVRHFGDAGRAIGQALRLEERTLSIVGVLPADFHFPLKAEVWFPLFWENASRTAYNYRVVARLKPDVSVAAAKLQLATIGERLQQAFPASNADKSFTVTPLIDLLVERSRNTLWMLTGAVVLVLLIACANVANLLLARATTRSREMALRLALGAGRGRLVGQLLAESLVLGLAGGAVGLLLAFGGIDLLRHFVPANVPRFDGIQVDLLVLSFNTALSIGAALLFGLWPALRSARVDLNEQLKQAGRRGISEGGRSQLGRRVLVVSEVALALVVILGAGLLFRSFMALSAVDLGYRTEDRIVVTASIPARTDVQYLQAGATFERIFSALRSLPGVSGAAGVMGLPSGPYGSDGLFAVEGMHDLSADPLAKLPQAGFRLTSPGYFAAMGVPLLEGRDFNEHDLFDGEPVAIVSASLVRTVFEGKTPLGRRIKCGLDRDVWMRVIGVVGDMRNDNPATPPGPELYMAYRQHPYHANDLHIVIRASGDVAAAARRTISTIDPEIPIKVASLEKFHDEAVALPRFRTLLLIVFALLAGALATAGVYGVMSYVAIQRQPEMGIRVALGATGGQVVAMMLSGAMKLAAAGLACGLIAAMVAGRWIESMLYQIRPSDPWTVGGAILALSIAALVAAVIPALRVARVDPASVLRQE